MLYVIVRLKEDALSLFDEKYGVFIVSSTPNDPIYGQWKGVSVNKCFIPTTNVRETISVWVASFLAFNIRHSRHLDATLELTEYGLGIRKKVNRKIVLNLLQSITIGMV